MKCHDFRELQIFVEYDHSRESIIIGRRLFDINVYSRRCLKIIRTHGGGRGGGATIRGNTVYTCTLPKYFVPILPIEIVIIISLIGTVLILNCIGLFGLARVYCIVNLDIRLNTISNSNVTPIVLFNLSTK